MEQDLNLQPSVPKTDAHPIELSMLVCVPRWGGSMDAEARLELASPGYEPGLEPLQSTPQKVPLVKMGVPTDPVIDLLVARAKLIRRREERLTEHLIDLRCRGLTPTDVDLLLEELANQACEDRAFFVRANPSCPETACSSSLVASLVKSVRADDANTMAG